MRLGITARLFVAFLAGSILIVLAMGVASRLSFTRGFIGYLNEQHAHAWDFSDAPLAYKAFFGGQAASEDQPFQTKTVEGVIARTWI